MAKVKMKQVVVPKFSSEAEEAVWWDANRSGVRSGNPATDETEEAAHTE